MLGNDLKAGTVVELNESLYGGCNNYIYVYLVVRDNSTSKVSTKYYVNYLVESLDKNSYYKYLITTDVLSSYSKQYKVLNTYNANEFLFRKQFDTRLFTIVDTDIARPVMGLISADNVLSCDVIYDDGDTGTIGINTRTNMSIEKIAPYVKISKHLDDKTTNKDIKNNNNDLLDDIYNSLGE